MFGKENKVGEKIFEKDIPTFDDRVIVQDTLVDTWSQISETMNSVSRQIITGNVNSFSLSVLAASDAYSMIGRVRNVAKYSNEIRILSKENSVDPEKVLKKVTSNAIRHETIGFLLRDITTPVINSIIFNDSKIDTPFKKAVKSVNLTGLFTLGLTETIDSIIVKSDMKKCKKNSDSSGYYGNVYYSSKDTTYGEDKKGRLKRDIITTGLTSLGCGIVSYILNKKAKSEIESTSTIIIGTFSPIDDKKETESKSKSTKKVGK